MQSDGNLSFRIQVQDIERQPKNLADCTHRLPAGDILAGYRDAADFSGLELQLGFVRQFRLNSCYSLFPNGKIRSEQCVLFDDSRYFHFFRALIDPLDFLLRNGCLQRKRDDDDTG